MPTGTRFDFNWLLDKPRDVAVVFAARMALRVAPLMSGVRGLRGGAAEDFGEAVVLPVFRAMAAPWVAGQYPAHGAALAHAADAACGVASFVAHGPRSAPLASARSAAVAASRAAGVAAASGYPNAVFRDPDAGPGAVEACLAAADTTTPADFAAAARADSDMIDKGASASALAALALWPAGRPDWVPDAWKRLEETVLAEDEDWRVWTDWYRARLEGGASNEALEVARVLIPDEIWQQGPRAVNAEIARLIAEHSKTAG